MLVIWNRWELLQPDSIFIYVEARGLISEKGKKCCRTFPPRRGFSSHETRLLTDYNKVCSDSSLSKRQEKSCLGRDDGTSKLPLWSPRAFQPSLLWAVRETNLQLHSPKELQISQDRKPHGWLGHYKVEVCFRIDRVGIADVFDYIGNDTFLSHTNSGQHTLSPVKALFSN